MEEERCFKCSTELEDVPYTNYKKCPNCGTYFNKIYILKTSNDAFYEA